MSSSNIVKLPGSSIQHFQVVGVHVVMSEEFNIQKQHSSVTCTGQLIVPIGNASSSHKLLILGYL